MNTFIYTTVLSGFRSRSIHVLVGLGVMTLGFAWLAANFSARNPTTLAMDVGFSALRLIAIIMALFWVQDMLAKDIERKSVLFLLAYPVSRASFILGQFCGIAILTAIAVGIVGVMLWAMLLIGPSDYPQARPVFLGMPYWTAILYQYIAVMVVAAFATLIATVSTTPLLPLVLGLAFAICATALGPTFDYLQTSIYAVPEQQSSLTPWLGRALWVLPDLSRLDIRVWALYGKAPEASTLIASLAMALGYIALALALSVNRFQRREFS